MKTLARRAARRRVGQATSRLRSRVNSVRRVARSRVPRVSRAAVRGSDHLRGIALRRWPRWPSLPLEQIIHAYARTAVNVKFVQVGAHDGSVLDPLRGAILGSGWSGVLIEPVPYVYARLVERYGGRAGLYLENVAIADHDGTMPFHYVPEADGLWHCYDALGSFRREVVVSHANFVPDIEERLVTVEVPCVTFDTVCRRNGIDHPNVVQIDTEGYDLEVLKGIDFIAHGPTIVMFEHLHLNSRERTEARELLSGHGYSLVSDGMDTIALDLGQPLDVLVQQRFEAAVDACARYAL